VLACAIFAGILLLFRNPTPPPPPLPRPIGGGGESTAVPPVTPGPQVPEKGTPGKGPGPAIKMVALQLSSEPAGAAVTVDGTTAEGKTPLSISVDSAKPHQLVFSLEGYQARRVQLAVGASPEVRAVLAPLGPPGSLKVASSYPVEVAVGGRVLAKGETSPTVTLPAGRHSVSVVAPGVFLRTTREVDVQAGATARLDLPGVGELNIQANPDNCKIFVDGTFVDYPPILKRPVVAGHHTVSFQWTDGGRSEEAIDVESGKPVYVTGRKD
jgi:hypothetical protein